MLDDLEKKRKKEQQQNPKPPQKVPVPECFKFSIPVFADA